ncbi:MAG: conjugal transfer protein TraD [Oscillospiraceae bacterium]|jgi:hypothetical protein|nr:conjugal transfer protein TraD [Oscillospiraceae bacterium]
MSKITLFAARTGITRGWRNISGVEFVGAYTKEQQRANREQGQTAWQNINERAKDTRRKIILGGLLVKYFPELKKLDPARESEFKGVAGWLAGQRKMGNRQKIS